MKKSKVPAELVITRLGGAESAIRYFENNKDFLRLSGVDFHLDLKIKELLNVHEPIKTDDGLLLDPANPISLLVVAKYEKIKTVCSGRTKNILSHLEINSNYYSGSNARVSFLNTYLFQNFDFNSIRHSGKKTTDEIRKMVEIIKRFQSDINEIIGSVQDNEVDEVSEIDRISQTTFQHYENLKVKCSTRTIHILSKLEGSEDYVTSTEKKTAFVEKLFFTNYNFNQIRSAGVKTVNELNGIRQALRRFVSARNPSETMINPVVAANNLEKYLIHSFPKGNLKDLKIGDRLSTQRVFCALLSELKLGAKMGTALSFHLFHNEFLTYRQIAEKAQCTVETVRLSVKRFENSMLPSLVDTLQTYSEFLSYENVVPDNPDTIQEIEPIATFQFAGHDFPRNFRRDRFVLTELLKKEYCFINEIRLIQYEESKSFHVKEKFFFLRRKLADDANITHLLEFLNGQIYQFESVRYDYNLRILIEQFYTESGQILAPELIDALVILIQKIKVENIPVEPGKIKRIELSKKEDDILSHIQDFLRNSQTGKRTRTIIEYLKQQNVGIGLQQLLALLGKSTNKFARVGHGAWVLKEWLPDNKLKGSVREIVDGILNDSEKPLHFSEILSFFQTFRPITENSLRTNLKVSENFHFTFFNCGFIGLKSKKYDPFWYQIPPLIPGKFIAVLENKLMNYDEKIKSLERLGFPRIHCEYLFQKRKEKGKYGI